MTDPDCWTQCAAYVYVRDTYRRSGRGSNRFVLHYRKQQCRRRATHGAYCWQHRSADTADQEQRP